MVGTDARLSNHMLKLAITAGFLSTGCDVVDNGLVPTPTLQYTVKEKQFDAGIIRLLHVSKTLSVRTVGRSSTRKLGPRLSLV